MIKEALTIRGLFFILIACLPGKLFSQTVGIGTTAAPRATLEVQGVAGTGYTSGIFGADGAGISLTRNWPTIGFNQYNDGTSRYMANGYAAVQYVSPATGDLAIDMFGSGTSNAPTLAQIRALFISNAGNAGMGTVATDASLYVVKGTNTDGAAAFGGTNYNSHFYYGTTEDIYIRPGMAGSNVYINDQSRGDIIMGNGASKVGINNLTPPITTLQIVQASNTGILLTEPTQNNNHWEQALESYGGGPQSAFSFFYNGQVKCYIRPTDGVFIYISDRRIKTNITPLPSVLDKILQLKPVTYELKYRNPEHRISWGFIAQEVQEIFPEMVTVSSQEVEKGVTINDFHALDYNGFKMIAVKGVQEEQLIIQKQLNVQEEITRRLEAIERKLQSKK
jgi:hypothetical protein